MARRPFPCRPGVLIRSEPFFCHLACYEIEWVSSRSSHNSSLELATETETAIVGETTTTDATSFVSSNFWRNVRLQRSVSISSHIPTCRPKRVEYSVSRRSLLSVLPRLPPVVLNETPSHTPVIPMLQDIMPGLIHMDQFHFQGESQARTSEIPATQNRTTMN
jgi:hypothetical protein